MRTFFILLDLRKPNLRSSLSKLSAQELVIAGALMFVNIFSIFPTKQTPSLFILYDEELGSHIDLI